MTINEDRLRELLQAAAPQLDGISPSLLEVRGRGRAPRLVTIAAAVSLAIVALVLATLGTPSRSTSHILPAHSSSPAPTAVVTGRLQATLMIIPPMQQPYPTYGTITVGGLQHLIRQVGTDGRLSVALPPGHYTVVGHTPEFIIDGRQGDCLPRTRQTSPIVVRAHQTTHVTVFCTEK